MDPLKKAVEECNDLTPNSVNPAWKADGTGFRSGSEEPNWNPNSDPSVNSTDTEDREIIWTNAGPLTRTVYLVVDEGNVYKPYLDRLFIFTDAAEAIEKVRTLLPEQDKLLVSIDRKNYQIQTELTPDMLTPGFRFLFKHENLAVYIVAVNVTGALKWL